MHRRSSSAPQLWTYAPYAAVVSLHVILLALQSPAAGPTKLLLMPALAIPVLASMRSAKPLSAVLLLLGAIVLSWLGDGAGTFFPAAPELPLMLTFFGLAHLAYIAVFIRFLGRGRMPWWALTYAVWWVAMIAVVGPHAGSLFVAVAIYGLVLGSTAAFAARCGPIVAVGGAFFLASDTLLALRLFLPDSLPAWSSPTIMLTYAVGQGLIVAGALMTLRRRTA